jgi:hypothetical protein
MKKAKHIKILKPIQQPKPSEVLQGPGDGCVPVR